MSESPEFKPAVSKMATSNQCDFYNRNGIQWMPINVTVKGKSKTPSYPDSELYKTICNQNDFKTLPAETISDRHGASDVCNYVAVDTNVVYVMDIDHEDTIDYEVVSPEGVAFVEHLKTICPYKRSTTKKKGYHFFFRPSAPITKNRYQTRFKDIEVLSGQWAFSPKGRKIRNADMAIPTIDFGCFSAVDAPVPASVPPQSVATPSATPSATPTTTKSTSKLKDYADLIKIEHLDNYDSWTKIVWALANDTAHDHKDLARCLSQKSAKYDEQAFNCRSF